MMTNNILFRNITSSFNCLNALITHSQVVNHSERVTEYIEAFSHYLKLDDVLNKRLILFAKFHDIGKYGIPQSILTKPDKLTVEEFEIMKMHSIYGSQIVSTYSELENLSILIRHHHERWDGRGYPDGLIENQIPYECRILAIVDAFDAMTGSRCYRDSISVEEALKEITINSGSQFDPGLVKHFSTYINLHLLATHVEN